MQKDFKLKKQTVLLDKWKVYNTRIRHVEFQVKSNKWLESIKQGKEKLNTSM